MQSRRTHRERSGQDEDHESGKREPLCGKTEAALAVSKAKDGTFKETVISLYQKE
jgi:hypothetical protein